MSDSFATIVMAVSLLISAWVVYKLWKK